MLVRQLITQIGDDPTRDGLAETPRRVSESWGHLFRGYRVCQQELIESLKLFEHYDPVARHPDSHITVANIPFYSFCEHHILPFFGAATVVYRPQPEGYIGLSKIPNLVRTCAAKLTTQEDLGEEIADLIYQRCEAVGVIMSAQHLCMAARNLDTGSRLTTVAYRFDHTDYKKALFRQVEKHL